MGHCDLERLRRQIFHLEGSRFRGGDGVVSSGCRPVDELLPEEGLHRGAVVEWFSAGDGVGAGALALLAAREACGEGGRLVVVDARREFYPPALIRFGIPMEQFLVVHAVGLADHLWALDQSLRCRGVAAVLAWPEQLDGRTFRRLPACRGGRRRVGSVRSLRRGTERSLLGCDAISGRVLADRSGAARLASCADSCAALSQRHRRAERRRGDQR